MTAIYNRVREKIEPVVKDRVLYEDMETAIQMIQNGELIALAQKIAKVENLAFETEWSELFEF